MDERNPATGWPVWVLSVLLGLALLPLPLEARGKVLGSDHGPRLELRKGDRVVFIGNTFAERMNLFGYFETLLATSVPELELTFRNLGWSADTLTLQPRPLNFGDLETHLKTQKADVIFACFGMNEAFEGTPGLMRFEQDWRQFLTRLRGQRFNGHSPPRIVLVSPVAHEDLGGSLPDPAEHNRNLERYTQVMRAVADDFGLPLVDLFTPTHSRMQRAIPPLTFNGIHVTAYGDWVMSQLMLRSLGLASRERGEEVTLEAGKEGVLRFRLEKWVVPPPPVSPAPSGEIVDLRPLVRIRDLKPGHYALRVEDQVVQQGDHRRWKQGVRLEQGPEVEHVEKIRQKILEKNQQFFYRWRAVNGEYIYGRRAEPFGVISFPPEMEQLDQMVTGLDQEIIRLAQSPPSVTYELVPMSAPGEVGK